jgi:hypothetical protein
MHASAQLNPVERPFTGGEIGSRGGARDRCDLR